MFNLIKFIIIFKGKNNIIYLLVLLVVHKAIVVHLSEEICRGKIIGIAVE